MHMKDIKVKMNEYGRDNGYELSEEDFSKRSEERFFALSEEDFYPPEDCRLYSSCLDDIEGGDSFADYVEYFWAVYENHVFDCNN